MAALKMRFSPGIFNAINVHACSSCFEELFASVPGESGRVVESLSEERCCLRPPAKVFSGFTYSACGKHTDVQKELAPASIIVLVHGALVFQV